LAQSAPPPTIETKSKITLNQEMEGTCPPQFLKSEKEYTFVPPY
jgi:hypothetical protein